jgi:hypothetical protein
MPLPVTLFAPEFLRLEHIELQSLLNKCREPLCVHLFLLIVSQCDFKTGQLITNYPRLIELCTPPTPERGRRMAAPTLKQVRRAMDWLEQCRLIKRNATANEAQGTLRINVRKRDKKPAQK